MIEQLNDALKNFRPLRELEAENSVKTTKKVSSPIVKIASLRIFIVKKIPNLGYF